MATLPGTPTTYVDGEQITAALLNAELRDSLAFLRQPPLLKVRGVAAQAIANATYTAVTFDTNDLLRDLTHSTSTNPTRLVVATAGVYQLAGQVSWNANTTGSRVARWAVNGTGVDVQSAYTASAAMITFPAPTIAVQLAAGDYVELQAYQSSGGSLNLNAGGSNATSALMTWLGA